MRKSNEERFLPPLPMVAPKMPPLKLPEGTKLPLHESWGVTPEITRSEVMKLIMQNENLAVKQKALSPLAREIGYDIDPDIQRNTQTIIFMMPQEISMKHKLVAEEKVVDI